MARLFTCADGLNSLRTDVDDSAYEGATRFMPDADELSGHGPRR